MSSEERSGILNGIWLCQKHAKLIDDDEVEYPASLLREWKETAEGIAFLEASGFAVRKALPFADLEKKAPDLIKLMRANLLEHPLVREFVVLPNNRVMYRAGSPQFAYFVESHPLLQSIIIIMINVGAVRTISEGRAPRYSFTEEFVNFLIGDP
ncbi:hypothetical protein [Bradyrhizobium tropiciagri]|uniref:hypothetical protein n=1 Tax=Bradyrhizobium tropiciagri TaxID=312253 RepID=UPI00067C15FA|nr:hypothetical protein [Bradyrhizobium tropiciagri]